LAAAAVDGSNAVDGKGHMLWIVLAYLLFTLGELLIFPIFMALITRLVPRRHSNLGAGLFFFAAGIGSYFSGQIGAMTAHYSEIEVFMAIGVGALAAGVVALLVSGKFSRWIDA
jgi:POT family proton-dependent oligopeptide transporter